MGKQLTDVALWEEYLSSGRPIHLRNKLAANNINLIWEVISKLKKKERSFDKEDPDDLFQQGYFGLNSAIERFEMREGAYFYKFAYPFIQGRIRGWLRDKSKPIRIPVVKHDIAAKFFKAKRQLEIRGEQEITLRKIFNELPEKEQQLGIEKVKEVLRYWLTTTVYNETAPSDDNSVSVYDVVPSKDYQTYNPIEKQFNQIYRQYPELKTIKQRLSSHPLFKQNRQRTSQRGKYAEKGGACHCVEYFPEGH